MYEIREFKAYDTDSIVDFIIKIQRNEYNINISLDDQPDLLKIDESYINDGGNFWVAQDQFGSIIGTLGVQRLSKNRAALKKMFVHSAYRNKKIGKSLINCLFQYCEDNKINEIYLGTTDEFKTAPIFYKKNGFKEISINELPKDFSTLEVDNHFFKKNINPRLYSPYQLHVSQKIPDLSRQDRIEALKACGNNVLALVPRKIKFDLFTDSSRSAISIHQFSEALLADEGPLGTGETYSELLENFENSFGFEHNILFTQGRSAEAAFCNTMLGQKTVILSNKTFSTTQYHQNLNGAKIVNVHSEESEDFSSPYLFKGNVDLVKLERELRFAERNTIIWIELCSNYIGGHGLSYKNLKKIKSLALKFKVLLVMDATRILENAILIKKFEMPENSINSIIKTITSFADYLVMSLKKDFLCSSGGLISCRNKEDYLVLSDYQITHGGEISGYEKSLVSIGLMEAFANDTHIEYRYYLTKILYDALRISNIPVLEPSGVHGVWIDIDKLVENTIHRNDENILIGIQNTIYIETGIRVGIQQAFGRNLVRLALPHRLYDESQIRYIASSISKIFEYSLEIKRYIQADIDDSITSNMWVTYLEK